MRKLICGAVLGGLALPVWADDAALLIGVGRYAELSRVSGGADLLRAEDDLRDAGYLVTAVADGAGAAAADAIAGFQTQMDGATRLVVGLSGRFVTDGARTWLLAADAPAPALFDLDGAISVDSVLMLLAQTPGQAVLALGHDGDDGDLDAFLREGLGDLAIPQGVTVVTGPPNQMDNVLSDAVARQGADVVAFARDSRRLSVSGYVPATLVMQPDSLVSVVLPDPAPVAEVDPSLAAWEAAQAADTADSYRNFVFAYPRSVYAAEARRRLDVIESDPVRMAELAEDALDLSRNARREVQRDLTLLGYNTRGVDGIFGRGSRAAIRNWQQENGFAQTSYLTAEQISRIDGQASLRAAEAAAEQARARAEAEQLDRAFWEETGARGNQAGYQAYLDRYPEGIFADQARAAIAPPEVTLPEAAPEPAAGADDGVAQARRGEEALNINPVIARLIETRLDQLGANPGRVDGRFDRDTRSAIARYQSARNLPSTGYLSQATLARLLADSLGR